MKVINIETMISSWFLKQSIETNHLPITSNTVNGHGRSDKGGLCPNLNLLAKVL